MENGLAFKTTLFTDLYRAESDTCLSQVIDISNHPYYYYKGAGGPFYEKYDDFGRGWLYSLKLTYFKKGNTTWGTPWPANVGLREEANRIQVKTYPNPAENYCTFQLPDNQTGILNLYGIEGNLIITQKLEGDMKVDLSSFSNGIYYYKVTTSKGTGTGKLIITKNW